jgi:hypothetical protein
MTYHLGTGLYITNILANSQLSWIALSSLPEVIVQKKLYLSVALSYVGHLTHLLCIPILAFTHILFIAAWITPNCAANLHN